MTISYHSMGNLVYWDFAGNKVAEQSKALAELVTGITGYRINRSSGKGGFKDYVQIKDSPIPSLTIEVGSVACPMPVSEFGNVWNSNQSILAALAWLTQQIINKNEQNSLRMPVTVLVTGIFTCYLPKNYLNFKIG